METTMTDYAHKAATTGSIYLSAISEYDLYCHYVPGLVGEGLFRILLRSIRKPPSYAPSSYSQTPWAFMTSVKMSITTGISGLERILGRSMDSKR